MANPDLIYRDAIVPRQAQTTGTIPPFIPPPADFTGPRTTGLLTAPNTDGVTSLVLAPSTAISATPSSSAVTTTAASSATSTPSDAAASDGGMPLGTKLAVIIAPIAFVIILVPLIYIFWIRHRTRNMRKLESEPRYSPSPSKEPKFKHVSPKHSPKPSFLPPMFPQSTKESSLFDEVRVSMESQGRKESVGLFDRNTRDINHNKDSSYGVYALRRSLEDKGRTDSIGLFDLPRSNERTSPLIQPQRGPSPTLPSPKVPLFDRPPSEAWPLPPSKLPAPQQPLYDPHINTNKPLPAPNSLSSPPNIPLPSPPGQRLDNQQPLPYASNVMPPSQTAQDYRPGSSSNARPAKGYAAVPNSSLQPGHVHGGTSRALAGPDSPSSTYGSPTFSPLTPGEHGRRRQRDSDLVSELSYRSPSADRDPRRRSTDALSVISAISHRRRRSERDADALSMISALSPDQEDIPRIPTEHYPL